MKTIGITANTKKSQAKDVLRRLAQKASELGIRLVTCDDTSRFLKNATFVKPNQLTRRIEALIALGGDGTMIYAVRLLAGSKTPVLGVNLGNLGFMTSVTEKNLERALDAVAKGKYAVSVRSTIWCALWRGKRKLGEYRAINDIVLGWGQSSRIITLDVSAGRDLITSYRCDGLIVSTPTGSTGHSLSAGGPVVHPETRALLLNVICPHTLSTRPLIIPDQSGITVEVTQTTKKLLLSVDGQEEHPVEQGDKLVIRRSAKNAHFIHLADYNYFGVLRQKLQWRGSSLER